MKYRLSLLFLVLFFFVTLSNLNSRNMQTTQNDTNYVPDEQTAIKVAEAIWLPIYGKQIDNNKPFKARLLDSNIWIVEGTLHETKGGVPYIEIQKSDCKILKVTHGK